MDRNINQLLIVLVFATLSSALKANVTKSVAENIVLNNILQSQRGNNISFRVQNEENEEINLILQNADNRGGREPIYISQKRERFQILNEHKELFFGQTLEIIYQVRCNLVHGNFDIENKYFIKLIESSYKILYPIMERIYQNIEE